MALAPSFKGMLRKSMDDIKKPEAIPEGTYLAVVKGHELLESSQKKTPFARFNVIPKEAMDGVSRDDLEAALQGEALSSKKLRADFYFTEDALYRFKEFCTSVGIETSGRSIEECLMECDGKQVLIDVTRTVNKEGDAFYNNINLMRGQTDE